MVRFNLTDIDAQNETTGMVREIIAEFNGYPWMVVMVVLWIGSYVYALNRNTAPDEAFLASSFFMSIFSTLSYLAKFISVEIAVIPLVMLIGTYIYIRMR